MRKIVGQDKDSLIGKQKECVQAKQNMEFIHYFPSAGRCSAISRKAGLHHTDIYYSVTPNIVPPFSFFLQLLLLRMTSHGMGYPFGQLGSAVLAVSPPRFLCTLSWFWLKQN